MRFVQERTAKFLGNYDGWYVVAILSRPGGTGFESIDTFDDEKLFDSIASEFNDSPDQNAVGVVEQGWEWIEHPKGSGKWFTRHESGGVWSKHDD